MWEIHDRLDLSKRHLLYGESDYILNVAYNMLRRADPVRGPQPFA